MQHITIFRQRNRFAGWPANYGIWSWGDEIVIAFTVGHLNPRGGFHARDKGRPFVATQARTLDGGVHWTLEGTPWKTPGGAGALSADEHVNQEIGAAWAIKMNQGDCPRPSPGTADFANSDFALMCARTGLGTGAVSWFYTSPDRCRTWNGPFSLPMFGESGIEARTDYFVNGHTLTLFLSASGSDGQEGARVIVAQTRDGTKSFSRIGVVTSVQSGYAIMPASVCLATGQVVTAIRRYEEASNSSPARYWIDLYESKDDCHTFNWLSSPVPSAGKGGNPADLLLLDDGRLCLVYGHRDPPFGIHARLSDDGGQTWSREIVLRRGAGNHDIGYPRAVQRRDGAVVAIYYYNDQAQGERYLAATIWKPDARTQ